MSRFIYLYGFFYALITFAAVNPPAGTAPAAGISESSTGVSTATATATAPNLATAPAPAAPVATQISFSDGSVTLNSAATQNLQIALREAGLKGKIAEIRVLGWGDTPVPAGQAASSTQISLAEQRSQAVAGYLRAANPAVPVKTINVAQRPTALQTLLASPELRAQSALGRVGIINPGESTKRAVAVVVMILR